MPQDHETPELECPFCHYRSNFAATVCEVEAREIIPRINEAPAPGDMSICFGCTGVLVYTDRHTLRPPTVSEWSEVLANPEAFMAIKALQRDLAEFKSAPNPFRAI